MENFVFSNPVKIHFGAGQLDNLGKRTSKYGSKCMLITTSNDELVLQPLYNRTKKILTDAGLSVFHFDEAVPNPTVQSIEKAIGIVKKEGIEVIVALGGGSSIDTAKSVTLFYQPDKIDWEEVYQEYTSPFAEYEPISNPILPLISVPTTSGTGSELTQAMVISDLTTQEKVCIFHDKVFPKEAIIDTELTVTLPARMTALTGFDAFAHAFESYMRDEANVYTKTIGLSAMRSVSTVLPALMDDLSNIELREQMSVAEMFAGISLANAAATIPHPLSEIIGGICPSIAHGQCLACIYPGFLRYQITVTPEKCADVARVFDESLIVESAETAAAQLPRLIEEFLEGLGIKKTLAELGATKEEMQLMKDHFLLTVLPFAPKETLIQIMESTF